MSTSQQPRVSVGLGVRADTATTAIFEMADRVVEQSAADDPTLATFLGIGGYDAQLTDYTPNAADARAEHARSWLAQLEMLPVTSDDDRLAASVLQERLGARLGQYESGEHLRDCNDLFSPVQASRDAFNLMSTETDGDWDVIAQRMEAVPAALASLRVAYLAGVSARRTPARRQVLAAARTAAIASGLEADGEPTRRIGSPPSLGDTAAPTRLSDAGS
jgi:uncharacterized protein (DUF885 family)